MDKNAQNVEFARLRARILADIRAFFSQRHVLEVDTPALSAGVISDAHIEPFVTRFSRDGSANSGHILYLHTSPERAMKKLLAAGYPDIYQICKVFRNGESGRLHSPEFTILEWYRRGFSMREMIAETLEMCRLALGGDVSAEIAPYQGCFIEETGIDPLDTDCQALERFCREHKRPAPSGLSLTDLLQYVMASFIEPSMPPDMLMCIHSFPAEQAVLAGRDSADSRVSLRFEIYYNGVELANGFEELTGSAENRSRLEAENEKRRSIGKAALPFDEEFIRCMDMLPPCSGVAVGVDRLVMCAAGKKELAQMM